MSDIFSLFSIAKIGTLYQSLGATAVSQYGQKVKNIYERKPWNLDKQNHE